MYFAGLYTFAVSSVAPLWDSSALFGPKAILLAPPSNDMAAAQSRHVASGQRRTGATIIRSLLQKLFEPFIDFAQDTSLFVLGLVILSCLTVMNVKLPNREEKSLESFNTAAPGETPSRVRDAPSGCVEAEEITSKDTILSCQPAQHIDSDVPTANRASVSRVRSPCANLVEDKIASELELIGQNLHTSKTSMGPIPASSQNIEDEKQPRKDHDTQSESSIPSIPIVFDASPACTSNTQTAEQFIADFQHVFLFPRVNREFILYDLMRHAPTHAPLGKDSGNVIDTCKHPVPAHKIGAASPLTAMLSPLEPPPIGEASSLPATNLSSSNVSRTSPSTFGATKQSAVNSLEHVFEFGQNDRTDTGGSAVSLFAPEIVTGVDKIMVSPPVVRKTKNDEIETCSGSDALVTSVEPASLILSTVSTFSAATAPVIDEKQELTEEQRKKLKNRARTQQRKKAKKLKKLAAADVRHPEAESVAAAGGV